MLVIRLQRTGRRNAPAYRIVVAEKTAPVKGRSVEVLGHYLPTRETPVVECDTAKASEWIKKGATPSDTVARLLSKNGVKEAEKFVERYTKKRPKKEPEPEPVIDKAQTEEAPPPPAAEAAAEAPAEEAPKEEAKESEDSNEEEKPTEPESDSAEATPDKGDNKEE